MGSTRGPPAPGTEGASAKNGPAADGVGPAADGDGLAADGDGLAADGDGLAADLFALLWTRLADILGTAAAATLLRRAAQCALQRAPELAALHITRQSLDYRYTLPSSWTRPGSDPRVALSALTCELWPLLVDLTGSVVIQRLEQAPELRALVAARCEETEV